MIALAVYSYLNHLRPFLIHTSTQLKIVSLFSRCPPPPNTLCSLVLFAMKSRTVVGRTLSKVKDRISSIGSLVSNSTDNPNPLVAPPKPFERPVATITASDPTLPPDEARVTSLDGAATPPSNPTPTTIAGLNIKTESWTVFNAHPKYHATAYVKIDVTCVPQSGGVPCPIPLPTYTNPGILQDLALELSLEGPGITLSHYGHLAYPVLKPSCHWINLIHIGIKDTSLASKLTTSFRSLGRSASRSAGRLGRYTNIDLINKWLHVLESDDAQHGANVGREPLILNATVRYKHSLLPKSTLLKDKTSCRVKMTQEEIERAEISGVDLKKTSESDDEGDSIEEDEERLREARVWGAPWLL